MKARRIKKLILARAGCKTRGHFYDTPVFTSNCLYFCVRCDREMFDRTFDDLTPMTDEEIEEMHRFNDAYDK